MLANIHLCKGAGIPHPNHFHGEVAEEVNDFQGPRTQAKDENKGRDDGAQQLLQDEDLRGRGGGPQGQEGVGMGGDGSLCPSRPRLSASLQ